MCPAGSQCYKLIVLAIALILVVPILVACDNGEQNAELTIGGPCKYTD